MKAILEFDLPEDNEVFTIAVNSLELHGALYEIDNYLRSVSKHQPDVDRETIIDQVRSLASEAMWKTES